MPQVVYSDAPDFDQGWVGQIFETANIDQKFQIMDQNQLLDDVDPMAYSFAERTITDIAPRTHRADADAYRLALLYHLAKYGEITNLL
ncbi:hypothetical protein [Terasakiella pusilla]|uniref:hypothetical protein n=1 Tax=Terasakiella pusilla TaxID=64973 RepID=UPI003AA86676